jgi:tetratricopeptide (TPR) repeat protein
MPGQTLARFRRGAYPVEATRARRAVLRTGSFVAAGLAVAACSSGAAGGSTTTTETPATQLFNSGLSAEQQARYQQGANDFEAVLQLQPRSYLAAYDLGVADAALNRTSAAAAAYRRSLSVNPKFRSALYNLALLYSSGEPAKAVPLFAKLETIDPRDPNVEFNFGLVLEHVGRVKAGESQLTAALKAEPSLKHQIPKGTTLPKGT